MKVTDLPGQATVGAAVGAVDAGRPRAQRELCKHAIHCTTATGTTLI